MNFEKEKKDCLSKIDKSKKGSIDKKIKELVDLINSLKDYYTTSSCSGRILLIKRPKSGKKCDVDFLFEESDLAFQVSEFGLQPQQCMTGMGCWCTGEGEHH